jgi:hypothetical protein
MINNLAELKFLGGYPTGETLQKLYDQLDLQRAAQAYLDFMPAMSMQALVVKVPLGSSWASCSS